MKKNVFLIAAIFFVLVYAANAQETQKIANTDSSYADSSKAGNSSADKQAMLHFYQVVIMDNALGFLPRAGDSPGNLEKPPESVQKRIIFKDLLGREYKDDNFSKGTFYIIQEIDGKTIKTTKRIK